jgi:hypothetical protein
MTTFGGKGGELTKHFIFLVNFVSGAARFEDNAMNCLCLPLFGH